MEVVEVINMVGIHTMCKETLANLWVCLNLKVVVTQVTLHPKLVYGSTVVVAHFGFLCVVANTHPHMRATAIAPYVVGELKPLRKRTEDKRREGGKRGEW